MQINLPNSRDILRKGTRDQMLRVSASMLPGPDIRNTCSQKAKNVYLHDMRGGTASFIEDAFLGWKLVKDASGPEGYVIGRTDEVVRGVHEPKEAVPRAVRDAAEADEAAHTLLGILTAETAQKSADEAPRTRAAARGRNTVRAKPSARSMREKVARVTKSHAPAVSAAATAMRVMRVMRATPPREPSPPIVATPAVLSVGAAKKGRKGAANGRKKAPAKGAERSAAEMTARVTKPRERKPAAPVPEGSLRRSGRVRKPVVRL